MGRRVRKMIREEVGDGYFCILVDEAKDVSDQEQMTIILRFVDNDGDLKERFLAIKSVSDTTSLNLKKEIDDVFVLHDLQVQKLRGQGYDGANNMRGTWNGLQALFLRDCPYAYYITDLDCLYKIGRFYEKITVEHHYHFDVFNEAIDYIMIELNMRFNDTSLELLSLMVALDPKNSFESFNSDDICKLAQTFYLGDFIDQDIIALEYELIHFQHDVIPDPQFQVSSLVELSKKLTKSRRSKIYVMLTRLIHLILTLPVSTATAERAFSAMKHVKTALRNKMEDDFLADCLSIHIERCLVKKIDAESIIDEFYALKPRRSQFR